MAVTVDSNNLEITFGSNSDIDLEFQIEDFNEGNIILTKQGTSLVISGYSDDENNVVTITDFNFNSLLNTDNIAFYDGSTARIQDLIIDVPINTDTTYGTGTVYKENLVISGSNVTVSNIDKSKDTIEIRDEEGNLIEYSSITLNRTAGSSDVTITGGNSAITVSNFFSSDMTGLKLSGTALDSSKAISIELTNGAEASGSNFQDIVYIANNANASISGLTSLDKINITPDKLERIYDGVNNSALKLTDSVNHKTLTITDFYTDNECDTLNGQ